jgi:hydroxyacylglutathione hydrolase
VVTIETIETPSLGDRSYLIHDGTTAVVVDPQRDIDRVLERIGSAGLQLSHVLETHVHNDYVSGGYELARRTGATYALNADDELHFEAHGLRDGDVLDAGTFQIRAMHTPGHTPTHLSYVVIDGDDGEVAVCTGGSLLYGSVGRTDLVSRSLTEELTRLQHRSAHRLTTELKAEVKVLPTHGFGSFCSSASSDEEDDSDGTIGGEREVNLACTITDEDEFVETLISGLDAYPRYYVHMAPRNRTAPGPIDLSLPTHAEPGELRARIDAGEWVVDLRTRTAYAADHVQGTVNVELSSQFITYLAWLVPWNVPVTLVGDTVDEVAEAQRDLARVGIDRPAAQATGGIDGFAGDLPRGAYRVVDFTTLRDAVADVHVLDVRRDDERRSSAIPGSQHIPLHELERRVDEVPDDREVWVHCASGYRASIAASLLARGGRQPVLLDDEFDRVAELGLDGQG